MKKRSILSILGPFIFSLLTLHAQDYKYVEWIEQYPQEGGKTEKRFIEKVDKLIFGDKSIAMLKPVSSFCNSEGRVWVLCQGNKTILSLSEHTSPEDIFKGKREFPSLVSACYSGKNKILFTDSYLNKIYTYSLEDQTLGIFTNDSMMRPTGIAYSDMNQKVWIVDTKAHLIKMYNLDGTLYKNIGSRGSGKREFNFPTHICIDNAGNAYIVDAMNFRIQIFNSEGEYMTMFGQQGDCAGSLARPKGVAVDSNGNIYIADALFHTIQIFNNKGEFLYYFGQQGNEKSEFWMPTGVHIDNKDYIYVSDSYNDRVQVFKTVNRD